MKTLLKFLLILSACPAQLALAMNVTPNLDSQVEAALEVIRASNVVRANSDPRQLGKVVMKIGGTAAGVGATVFAVDVGLFLAGAVDMAASPAGGGSISFLLFGGSALVMSAGSVVVVSGALIYGIESLISPSQTAHDQLDDYFLSSSENFREFLNAPIEQQRSMAMMNKRIRDAVLGLAAAILEQSHVATSGVSRS